MEVENGQSTLSSLSCGREPAEQSLADSTNERALRGLIHLDRIDGPPGQDDGWKSTLIKPAEECRGEFVDVVEIPVEVCENQVTPSLIRVHATVLSKEERWCETNDALG